MRECKGVMGKIFGHKYKSMLVETEIRHDVENVTPSALDILDKLSHKKYKIVCLRCCDCLDRKE